MKMTRAKTPQKVCCPHCRQNVVLEPLSIPIPEPVWTLPSAALQLEEILRSYKAKRLLLDGAQREIEDLEAQARSLGQWLQTQESSPEDVCSSRVLIDLQARLFDQVSTLKKGYIAILDCNESQGKTLAHSIGLTFEAFGWTVDYLAGPRAPHCGEEITFIVAPGLVQYSVAAVYMALQSSGFRLHSRIDLEQKEEHALLCVHRVSNLPRLLLSPPILEEPKPLPEYRKTA